MNIAYVTSYNADDLSKFSGLGHNIWRALDNQYLSITKVGNLKEKFHNLLAVKDRLYNRYANKKYYRDREICVSKGYAKQVQERLKNSNFDIIFSPGTLPIAFLDYSKPIAFWTDSTFGGMVDFYPAYSNLCSETIKSGNIIESQALKRCGLAIYSSDWAAKTAIDYYDVDPKKVKVVPFGANLPCDRKIGDIELLLKTRPRNKCKLLFVGVDWYRKGGDIALAVASRLNQIGLETELKIVGCLPSDTRGLPDFVKIQGYISKKNADGIKMLNNLFADSHFFIMPSRFEAYGVVFCEASSFGVPSIASVVGGIPTAVKDGINGKLFPLNSDIEEYSSFIVDCFSNYENYENLALSSFFEYQSRLNWGVSGKIVKKHLKNIL